MTWVPQSPAWTRKNLLGHIALSDWIVFTEEKDEHDNLTRRWYALFRHIGEDQVYYVPVLSQTLITTPVGSLQTSTSDATWDNANNTVECLGAGASGGASQQSNSKGAGGGGGAWSKYTNFSFATPGTTTYQWQLGTGGAGKSTVAGGGLQTLTGNNGGDTWFAGATFAGASLGAEGGKGGNSAASTVAANGGLGGAAANRPNTGSTTGRDGGRGGNIAAGHSAVGSGGGGAAGSTGVGNQGVDSTAANSATSGGSADNGGTGAGVAGTGSTTFASVTPGGNGTEWTTQGSGGGGGGHRGSANALITLATVGAGGNKGGGGGGIQNSGSGGNGSTQATSGAGKDGIIVLTWTPPAAVPIVLKQRRGFFFR